MNYWIEPVNVIETIKSFLDINEGDEATEQLLLAVGCELLDVSEDRLVEMIDESRGV